MAKAEFNNFSFIRQFKLTAMDTRLLVLSYCSKSIYLLPEFNVAKAGMGIAFYPSVETDGNRCALASLSLLYSKRHLSIAVAFKQRIKEHAMNGL